MSEKLEVTKPKKRGRKPKNIIKDTSKTNDENKIENNLIIHLQKKDTDDNNGIDGFDIDSDFKEVVDQEITKSEVCWNCCHPFNDLIYGIPLKYHESIFYIYGCFCSFGCCARYAHDNYSSNFSEIYTLINLYSNILFHKKEKIKLAPNRLLLKMFGGHLCIEEYRHNIKNTYDVNLPPILPLKHVINEHEINYATNKNVLKLYRKNPIVSEKNSIKNSMNLIIKEME